jgi:hypothetical protein
MSSEMRGMFCIVPKAQRHSVNQPDHLLSGPIFLGLLKLDLSLPLGEMIPSLPAVEWSSVSYSPAPLYLTS